MILLFFLFFLASGITGCSKKPEARKLSTVSGPLPGSSPFNEELLGRFAQMKKKRGKDYQPRTRHLQNGFAKYTNRLFLEVSPYLLQHAHNPVNWYPWGEEAFEEAKRLNRPVLLSIGYSTCHWCHVMEEESFEDEEIARVMNENYIAIKVDREERPDVDSLYMAAVQMLTGTGGWPTTLWLTPDKRPFYGGTYFPARDGDRGAQIGFLTLLKRIADIYKREPQSVLTSANQLKELLQKRFAIAPSENLPTENLLHKAFASYEGRFDPVFGGLGSGIKFPSSLPLRLLLRYYKTTGNKQALHMAELTLQKMAEGGLHDQIGGGFHRYSTDSRWLIPHFEKMLYDNALLTLAYLEGYQVTGEALFREIAERTLQYVMDEMTAPGGAFYSATDADSLTPAGHKEEGYYFSWTPEEIEKVLSKEKTKFAFAYYSIGKTGNFEKGRTVFSVRRPLEAVAHELEISKEKARSLLKDLQKELLAARKLRPAPLLDKKILASSNGLMISAFSRASLVLGNKKYLEAAQASAHFIFKEMVKKGKLYHSFNEGIAKPEAFLDDYAFLISGLLDLYESSSNINWLEKAIALDQFLKEHFEDKKGGYFLTSDEHELMLTREKPLYDGAEPSGNSLQLINLMRLSEFTTDDGYRKSAVLLMKAFLPLLEAEPASLSEMLIGIDFYLGKPKEIILVSPTGKKEFSAFLEIYRKNYLPQSILISVDEAEVRDHQKRVPLLSGKKALGGKSTAFVCTKGICDLPTSDPLVFEKQIIGKK